MKKESVFLAYREKRAKLLSKKVAKTIIHIGGFRWKKKMKKEGDFLAYREKRVSS